MPDWYECRDCKGTGIDVDSKNVYSYGEFFEKVKFEIECYYCKGIGEVYSENGPPQTLEV